ncbi:SCO family protein [Candidatus Halobeggiatoa sp. HSG11]|nr:SCO family protein [Candidatus Halobeggiatoa sp. HSG11]
MTKRTTLIVSFLVVTGIGFGIVGWFFNPQTVVSPELQGILRPESKALRDFNLVAQNQTKFNLASFKDKWTLLFFGYTFCPDICPTTLAILKKVYTDLKPDVLANTQVVFVSVDPERDTPEQLANYIAYFDENFVGVTGEVVEINKLVLQTGAGYIKGPAPTATDDNNYQISHTSTIFLINPEMKLHAGFAQPHIPEIIVEQYNLIRSLY